MLAPKGYGRRPRPAWVPWVTILLLIVVAVCWISVELAR
jgi:hypothetical protein